MSLVTKGLKALGRGGEKKAARKGAEELAVRKVPVKPKAPVKSDLTVPRKAPAAKPKPKPKALPAPEKRLALPAPGPGLPDYAAKPRGGQWVAGHDGPHALMNPAEAVKNTVYLGERFSSAPRDKALTEWLDRALPRYIQNDFATPDDPLRALADQGYIPGVQDAVQWSGIAKQDIVPFPLQEVLFNDRFDRSGVKGEMLAAMPWINKLPATENLYGVWPREGTLGVYGHVLDEMRNALRAEEVGLPTDLAVRPESLARMSFPQAVERVGRINQWRAKEADRAALSALESPAIQVFKEYPENNPGGLRWVELRQPGEDAALDTSGYSIEPVGRDPRDGFEVLDPQGRFLGTVGSQEEGQAAIRQAAARNPLQEALKYEGDVMGHCVGGYCDDVLSGRSRIFSLRDARGEPHVTIETSAQRDYVPPQVYDQLNQQVQAELRQQGLRLDPNANQNQYWQAFDARMDELVNNWKQTPVENIVQIKGKQNQAPKADYLPYVQDFVKSGQWGEIGDIANTGLVRLPDQRLVSGDQWRQGIRRALIARNPVMPDARLNQIIDQEYPDPGPLVSDQWDEFAPYFEGFAVGGRVRNNLAARGR